MKVNFDVGVVGWSKVDEDEVAGCWRAVLVAVAVPHGGIRHINAKPRA